MNLTRKLFGSGIIDDRGADYHQRVNDTEQKIADQRAAMYKAVMDVSQSARVFANAAGEMRMLRGGQ